MTVSQDLVAFEMRKRIVEANESIQRVLDVRQAAKSESTPYCAKCDEPLILASSLGKGPRNWVHAFPPDDHHEVVLPAGLHTVAHDSGDGESIFHCPFCGSGAVVGGSDGTVSCGFCKKAFTVQVQPVFKNMPQTVEGQPYNIPGMPGGGPDAGAENVGTPAPPDAQPIQDAPIDDAGAGAPDPQDASGGSSGGGNQPPWLRPTSGLLVADNGVALPSPSMMRRLALAHADDRDVVLQDVRDSRG